MTNYTHFHSVSVRKNIFILFSTDTAVNTFLTVSVCVCLCMSKKHTVSEVKVRQIPPKPLKETARKMRTDSTDGAHGN